MNGIYLYDDARARTFEPFALTRPLSELMAGAALQRERWTTALQRPAAAILAAPHLADFEERWATGGEATPPIATGSIPAGSVIVNSRFAPKLSSIPNLGGTAHGDAHEGAPDMWMSRGRAVAVRTPRELPVDYFADGKLTLDEVARSSAETVMLEGWWMEEVWDFIRFLPDQLSDDIVFLKRPGLGGGPPWFAPPPPHAAVIGEHAVLLAADRTMGVGKEQSLVFRGATIEPHVVLDASAGPIHVGAGSTVHAFTRLVGPCYVGRQSTVLGDRVTACSIGDVCKVRGEMSNTIVLGHSNKSHDGFVGHSYLGRWVNLGAGTITSNLKNTYGSVALWTPHPRGVRDTGLPFLGTLFGDHAKTGIGLTLTTGTVLGAGANVYGTQTPPKVVSPFAWGSEPPYAVYRLEKFLEVAERMMGRRHVELTARMRRHLAAAHAARWSADGGEGA